MPNNIDVKSLLTKTLTLSPDESFADKTQYWKAAAETLQSLLISQESIEALRKELILLENEANEVEADLQLMILQDRRLTNESQRKAALASAKLGNRDWTDLTNNKIPAIKQELDTLALKQEVLRKAYNLCYVAVTV
jgi:hypothetical protein